MERNTRTPVIDGGIVHAPPNTTATYDFAGNSPHSQSNTGATGPITHGERTANTMKYGPGSRGVVESGGVGPTAQSNDYYTGNAADTSGATGPSVTSDTRPTSSKIKESASGVKGLVAAAHGMGEMVRGNINAGIDRALNDKAGEAHNNIIASRGEYEINTGQFSNETKNREGVIPGADGDKRKNRDFLP